MHDKVSVNLFFQMTSFWKTVFLLNPTCPVAVMTEVRPDCYISWWIVSLTMSLLLGGQQTHLSCDFFFVSCYLLSPPLPILLLVLISKDDSSVHLSVIGINSPCLFTLLHPSPNLTLLIKYPESINSPLWLPCSWVFMMAVRLNTFIFHCAITFSLLQWPHVFGYNNIGFFLPF